MPIYVNKLPEGKEYLRQGNAIVDGKSYGTYIVKRDGTGLAGAYDQLFYKNEVYYVRDNKMAENIEDTESDNNVFTNESSNEDNLDVYSNTTEKKSSTTILQDNKCKCLKQLLLIFWVLIIIIGLIIYYGRK